MVGVCSPDGFCSLDDTSFSSSESSRRIRSRSSEKKRLYADSGLERARQEAKTCYLSARCISTAKHSFSGRTYGAYQLASSEATSFVYVSTILRTSIF